MDFVRVEVRDSARDQMGGLSIEPVVFFRPAHNHIPLHAIDYCTLGKWLMLDSMVRYAHNQGI